jgi:mono/diheme cytochrome c family protein
MASMLRGFVAMVLAGLLGGASLLAVQQQASNVNDGVYTEQQAARGLTLYKGRCSSCHGDALAGRSGPPLTGDDFLSNWGGQSLLELAGKISKTMPKNDTPRLTAQETADVLAYILQAGKFPSGRAELSLEEPFLKSVNFPVRIAGNSAQAPVMAGQLPSLPAAGSVAQVMRGMLFPSANIVFTVQSIDPGVKKPLKDDQGTGGFDWLTWGGSVYKPWEVVDYAAISVSESAKLMLTPGRRCENGKLVPVTDPDWIKFTMELADAGKAAYRASQSRSQEAVSDSTNQLNDACMHCHRVFRGRTHCVK